MIDFVVKVMGGISSSEPVLFQRDGWLYVASPEGFAQVNLGLPTRPETIQSWEKREQHPAITESIDALQERTDEGHKFIGEEQKYFGAIAFGPDDYSFSLEEMMKTAQRLAALSNDGKIRMVSHGNGYRSHKYGYACDGIDVWVRDARVMDRSRYLGLVREKEDAIFQEVESLAGLNGEDLERAYRRIDFSDSVIMTPYLMVSMPRNGSLGRETESWTKEMRLGGDGSGNVLSYGRGSTMNTYRESPYAVHVTLNTNRFSATEESELRSKSADTLGELALQLNAVNANMSLAQKIVDRGNAAHNKACAKNIDWKKGKPRTTYQP